MARWALGTAALLWKPFLAAAAASVEPTLEGGESRLHSAPIRAEGWQAPTFGEREAEGLRRGFVAAGFGPHPAPDGPNLVLAVTWALDAETSRFVRSLREAAPSARCALLVPSDDEMRRKAYLRTWGVELYVVELNTGPSTFVERFAVIANFLRGGHVSAERVMITDVRDVIFQGDPFAAVPKNKILISMEDSGRTIGTCPFNSKAILRTFGSEILAELGSHHISCSGVTLGSAEIMRKYAEMMAEVARRLAANSRAGRGHEQFTTMDDQAIHNCIFNGCQSEGVLFGFKAEEVLALPNEQSPVYTMGWVPKGAVRLDVFGRVLNPAGWVPAVVHQFDRHLQVLQLINSMYPVIEGGASTDGVAKRAESTGVTPPGSMAWSAASPRSQVAVRPWVDDLVSAIGPCVRRMRERLRGMDSENCERAARDLYREALRDYAEPAAFENSCKEPSDWAEEPGAGDAVLEAPRKARLAFAIAMVDEVEAVQRLVLSLQGPAAIHVDTKAPDAFSQMTSWAAGRSPLVAVRSTWSVTRAAPSQTLMLLELLEVVLSEIGGWDFVVLLKARHYPVRHPAVLAHYLWLRRLNLIGVSGHSDTSGRYSEDILQRTHLTLGLECGGHYWGVLADSETKGPSAAAQPYFPRRCHPNMTIEFGNMFFTALRHDFVTWLADTRAVVGSPAWVVLRYTLRLQISVETVLATLLANTAWCSQTSFRSSTTFTNEAAPFEFRDPEVLAREASEIWFSGQNLLTEADLPKLAEIANGRTATVFFAHKVNGGDGLRDALDVLIGRGDEWFDSDWPLAARVWGLLQPASSCGHIRTMRRRCTGWEMDHGLPCWSAWRLEGCGQFLEVTEKIALPNGASSRAVALQVGTGFQEAFEGVFSGDVSAVDSGRLVSAVLFWHDRTLAEKVAPHPARICLWERVHEQHHPRFCSPVVDAKGAMFGFTMDSLLSPGHWQAVAERTAGVDGDLFGDAVILRRPFFVYSKAEDLTKDVFDRYYEARWSREVDLAEVRTSDQ